MGFAQRDGLVLITTNTFVNLYQRKVRLLSGVNITTELERRYACIMADVRKGGLVKTSTPMFATLYQKRERISFGAGITRGDRNDL